MTEHSGRLLLVGPIVHVSASSFRKTMDIALANGLRARTAPAIALSRAALFELG